MFAREHVGWLSVVVLGELQKTHGRTKRGCQNEHRSQRNDNWQLTQALFAVYLRIFRSSNVITS